jgi:hypothetical protein
MSAPRRKPKGKLGIRSPVHDDRRNRFQVLERGQIQLHKFADQFGRDCGFAQKIRAVGSQCLELRIWQINLFG